MLASTLTAAITAGFAETWFAFQLTAVLSLLLWNWLQDQTSTTARLQRFLLSGTAGAMVGGAIMALAPGNAARQATLSPTHDLVTLLSATLSAVGQFLVPYLAQHRAPLVLLGGLGIAIAATTTRATWSRPWLRSIVTRLTLGLLWSYLLILAAYIPSMVTQSMPPPTRALTFVAVVMTFIAVWVGYHLGCVVLTAITLLPSRPARALEIFLGLFLVAILLVVPLKTGFRTLRAAQSLQPAAQHWDEQDALLRQQPHAVSLTRQGYWGGLMAISYPPFGELGSLVDLSTDPHAGLNQCYATYYRLPSLRLN